MDLSLLTERALTRAWQLAGALVQSCTYIVPAGFNAATGLTRPTQTSVPVLALIVSLSPREWDLITTKPGDERVLIRARELGSVVPVRGDYLVGHDGTRRDVQNVRPAASGVLWLLYCTPNLGEDWGDLTATTLTEDRAGLTTVTTSEDWGTLT
jgi:hypothetical protein